MKAYVPAWLAVGVPFALFLTHAALYGGWIIDDAAIGFAYGQNLADGHGLVSQPGAEPVEGYSAFLWVVLMVPFFRADLFNPVVTPKLVSVVLVLLTFLVVRHCLRRFLGAGEFVAGLTLTLLALNVPFVVWTTSGLENPLYVLLTTVLLWRALVLAEGPGWRVSEAVLCAVLIVAIALTRPDGPVYAVAIPLVALRRWLGGGDRNKLGAVVRFLSIHVGVAGLLMGSFLLFRYSYYHDLVPNTYHAKDASPLGNLYRLGILGILTKCGSLLDSLLGAAFQPAAAAGMLALTVWGCFTKRMRQPHFVWLLFMSLSASIFIVLPHDWMPLFRFATPFLVFFIGLWVCLAGEWLSSSAWLAPRRPLVAGAVSLLVVGAVLVHNVPRVVYFRDHLTMPFDRVAQMCGHRFNHYAEELDVSGGSVLVPDLGGTLLCSRLRVIDEAGLCDRTLGRTMGRDRAAIYHYVFEVTRPTFIHLHPPWGQAADLEADPRFARDYVPLFELDDAKLTATDEGRRPVGDYVRRDAIAGKEQVFAELREECRGYWRETLKQAWFRQLFPASEQPQTSVAQRSR